MGPITRLRQTADFDAFRCIGAACEDTCCGGWGVTIDRQTYEKYQSCSDPEMGPLLRQFMTIDAAKGTEHDFVRIGLTGNYCPFLAEGLCSVQLKLGESYLSNTCASYPRVIAVIDGTEERVLHLSCPEAARLVLLNHGPIEWSERAVDGKAPTLGALVLDSQRANRAGTPYPYFQEVRELFLQVLQVKDYARWQRLEILGQLAEEFNAILGSREAAGVHADETAAFIERWHAALRTKSFQFGYAKGTHSPIQVEAVLELIVARIDSDFTSHRFLECYRAVMRGLRWGPETTMEEIGSRYAEARARDYAPFIQRHEYLFDNFLNNYCLQMVFPYGHREIEYKMRIEYVEGSVRRQYLLLAVHYAVARGMMIGMTAFHGAEFGLELAVKLLQAYAKAFLHSSSFPEKALRILASHGIERASDAVVLFQE